MAAGTLVRHHVKKMLSYTNELETWAAKIDGETKIDAILSSLPKSFSPFILNFHMNKLDVTSSELLNIMQAAEDLVKKEKNQRQSLMS